MAGSARHWLWIGIGLVGIGMGTVRITWGLRDATKRSIDVAALESGSAPGGRYVEVHGGHVIEGFDVQKRVGVTWEHWLMYGTSREHARVLLKVSAARWPLPPGQDRFDGLYGGDFVPTDLIVPLVGLGRHTEQFEVLAVGETPGSTKTQGLGFVGIGLALILWHGFRLGWFRTLTRLPRPPEP